MPTWRRDFAAALTRMAQLDGQQEQLSLRANREALHAGRTKTRWQFLDPTGKPLSAEVELTALPSLAPDAYCVHIRDIGAVIEAQAELAASEARFRDLFEVADRRFRVRLPAYDAPHFIDCNACLASLYGATDKAQIVGATPLNFSPAAATGWPTLAPQGARTVAEQALRDGQARFDWYAARQNGSRSGST